MTKPVVLMVPESKIEEVLSELGGELLAKHNILVKVVEDYMFNTMFHFDTEEMDVDIDDDTFLKLARLAHEEDITINQTINKALKQAIDREQNK